MGPGSDAVAARLRDLPAVHELAAALEGPHTLVVRAARHAIDERRAELLAGRASDGDLAERARAVLAELRASSLRPVINATGVIVHTNLGRAPLAAAAQRAVADVAAGYSNLELDLDGGGRGSRHAHVEGLLSELTGAQAALVVNNGAGAVLLAAAALGGRGRAIVVSRGQLVEIGGGFRIPDVIAQSGARLIEVGTTNRTRLKDYALAVRAAGDEVGAVMRVHPSNFRALGFTAEVAIESLCELGVPVIDDIGSGVLDGSGIAAMGEEPPLVRSVAAGAALVCCSGDKLLGGPQAGIMVGRAEAVAAARSHPLARALRIDKLSLAALEATLRLYRDPEMARREVPVLSMLNAQQAQLETRATRLADGIGPAATAISAVAKVGGGALPLLELDGPAVALDGPAEALARRLRAGTPPVMGRIHNGRLVLDPRTLRDDQLDEVIAAARAALDR